MRGLGQKPKWILFNDTLLQVRNIAGAQFRILGKDSDVNRNSATENCELEIWLVGGKTLTAYGSNAKTFWSTLNIILK